MIVGPAWTRGNITIPQADPWFATRLTDIVSAQALTPEAVAVLQLALTFPAFHAPGIDNLHALHCEIQGQAGSRYRPFGINRMKAGNSELKAKGFYGIRRAPLGRAAKGSSDKRPRMAFVRSYGNEPHKHLKLLAALTDDEVRQYDQVTRESWARYEATGHFLHQRPNVISLEERRLGKAG